MSSFGRCLLAVAAFLICEPIARSDVTLLVQEPYGLFGAVNPTGHASVYFSRICAETPVILRRCGPGEFGVVIGRYYRIAGYDWIAIPLVPYLYAVEDLANVPEEAGPETVAALRDEYRRKYLQSLAPDRPDGKTPGGSWVELVGAAYNRRLYGFTIVTTEAQDERLISILNSRKNKSHFNLFFNNCADFSRKLLNLYFPGAIRRNYLADLGITTPQQILKSLLSYAKDHPDFPISSFFLSQIAGNRRPSRRVAGVSEGLVRSKKYIVPLAMFHPWIAAGIFTIYLTNGRFNVAHHATTMYTPRELSLMQDSSWTGRVEVERLAFQLPE